MTVTTTTREIMKKKNLTARTQWRTSTKIRTTLSFDHWRTGCNRSAYRSHSFSTLFLNFISALCVLAGTTNIFTDVEFCLACNFFFLILFVYFVEKCMCLFVVNISFSMPQLYLSSSLSWSLFICIRACCNNT